MAYRPTGSVERTDGCFGVVEVKKSRVVEEKVEVGEGLIHDNRGKSRVEVKRHTTGIMQLNCMQARNSEFEMTSREFEEHRKSNGLKN